MFFFFFIAAMLTLLLSYMHVSNSENTTSTSRIYSNCYKNEQFLQYYNVFVHLLVKQHHQQIAVHGGGTGDTLDGIS